MSFALSPAVLSFNVGVMFLAAVLFGLLPAMQATKADAGETLKEQGRSATGSVRQMRWGRFLVTSQLALSLPLLLGAGLLTQTVYNLQHLDLGYSRQRLLLLRIGPREAGYDASRRARLLPEVIEHLRRIPAVRAVSYSSLGLFSGGNTFLGIDVEGYTPKGEVDRGSSADVVGPGYFSTLGSPTMMGREILESDGASAPKVCVINEAFAKRFFQRRNPIGLHITAGEEKLTCQVVGIARNARTEDMREEIDPRFYLPAAQQPSSIDSPIFLIRTATERSRVLVDARQTIRRIDPDLPIYAARTLQEQLAPYTAQDRMTAQLAAVFGCVALTLSAIGLFGVLSYGTARRRGEIAVRVALGARPSRIIAMILREAAVVIVIGLAIGAALAYGTSRLIASQLYGIAPQDPATLSFAAGLLISVALLAAYVPAQRASRQDPMTALRRE
jgi:predicted permease